MHGQQDDLPVLIAQSTGELQGRRWHLEKDAILIGRGSDCDIVVADRQVSRHHARVVHSEHGYILEDLGSKNGTHLNGIVVKGSTVLQDGDVIQIALALKLAFIGSEATVPLTSAEVSTMGLAKLRMDPQAHRVWVGSTELDPPLSPPQYRLLELLYNNPGIVISRDAIIDQVWPGTEGMGVSDQAIDALVRRLRDRLAEIDPSHPYIVTVRGHGFRLDNPV
jgi:hypothetical protein